MHHSLNPDAELNNQNESSSGDLIQFQQQQPISEHQQNLGVSKKLSGALQRAQSIRDPRKSASTEDLLERSEDRQMTPQHQRSRSSPTEGRLNQVTQEWGGGVVDDGVTLENKRMATKSRFFGLDCEVTPSC